MTTTAPEYLDVRDLLDGVQALGVGPVRDLELLASAATRPQTTAGGQDAYPTLALKAAALLHALARNHPLVDGNKRLAWEAAATFLRINGHRPNLTQDEAFDLVMDVAQGLADVEEIAERLRIAPVGSG